MSITKKEMYHTRLRSGFGPVFSSTGTYESARGGTPQEGDSFWNSTDQRLIKYLSSSTTTTGTDFYVSLSKSVTSDFSTIQNALNYFAKRLLLTDNCKITVASGTYNETLDTSQLMGNILIEGDTRGFVGTFYVNGEPIISDASGAGTGNVTLSSSGNDITVTGSGTNPNFATAGIVNGDILHVVDNSQTSQTYTVSSVSSNVITLTGSAPAINNAGTVLAFYPNRILGNAQTFSNNMFGIKFKGFRINGAITNTSLVRFENCFFRGVLTNEGLVSFSGKQNVILDTSGEGLVCQNNGKILANFLCVSTCTNNVKAINSGYIDFTSGFSHDASTDGLRAEKAGTIKGTSIRVSYCDVGVHSLTSGAIDATLSTVKNSGTVGYKQEISSQIILGSETVTGNAKNYNLVNDIPTGVMLDYMVNSTNPSVPSGWLLCNGQAVSRITYEDLFTLLSTSYGTGDGSTTFNLPDKRGKVIAGFDNMGGSSANNIANSQADTVNGFMGAETHTLSTSEIPSHRHDVDEVGAFGAGGAAQNVLNSLGTMLQTGFTGGGGSHNNVQPTMFSCAIIKT